jgi:hypothetical protein
MSGKDITDLSTDIYSVLDATIEHDPDSVLAAEYAMRIGGELAKATLKRDKPREKGKLWASDLGKPCMRQHWFKFNMPEAGTKLMGHTKFKFLYGNILEEAVLYLAEEAGHDVSDQQARVETDVERTNGVDWQVSGRIDGIIDGSLLDVKSTSSFGFQRYKHGINDTNDSFGYRYQLGFYKAFGEFEAAHSRTGFLWIDKQNGHVAYTECTLPDATEILQRARDIADAVESEGVLTVDRGYSPEPYGKSGNECLPMSCSYCDFKQECWKDSNGGRGLRTFAYNHKPVHFTTIAREPKVPEITGEGDA